jgi:hypothetical protein
MNGDQLLVFSSNSKLQDFKDFLIKEFNLDPDEPITRFNGVRLYVSTKVRNKNER